MLIGNQALRPQKLAEIASRLLGRIITAAAPVTAAVVSPFITLVHEDFFALMRAGHAAAGTATVQQALGREPRTADGFLGRSLALWLWQLEE